MKMSLNTKNFILIKTNEQLMLLCNAVNLMISDHKCAKDQWLANYSLNRKFSQSPNK